MSVDGPIPKGPPAYARSVQLITQFRIHYVMFRYAYLSRPVLSSFHCIPFKSLISGL